MRGDRSTWDEDNRTQLECEAPVGYGAQKDGVGDGCVYQGFGREEFRVLSTFSFRRGDNVQDLFGFPMTLDWMLPSSV